MFSDSPPAVTVLMPVYNAAGLLRQGASALEAAVHSVLCQQFHSFELLAVDDGSTDGTAGVLHRLAAQDQRMRVLHVSHGGIVSALNAGLAAARGRYIARMDADDICHPHRLALQAAHLDSHPETGLVACRVRFAGDRAACGGYARYVDWTNTLLSSQDIALGRFRESPFAHPSVMFRASTVHAHGAYADGPFPEDYELWLRWLECGVRMAKLPQTLLDWYDPPTRLSRTHGNYGTDNFYRLKTRYLARWLAARNPHHPHVTVIGAGRTSRRRAALLREHGIVIDRWIDVDPRKIGNVVDGARVHGRDALPEAGRGFSLAYLAGHGAAEELVPFLESTGRRNGTDFLLAS
ncbi:glycosyltransferase [Oleidesulfovibrio alaskensis]|jgi:glycosyltransferase involved in cell wall biosynthesis|uniref:glycosyltransferase n=1 Tax=Oleidesulfovibrio alaskensis TaxID=58180 RepID=UPI001A6271CF|nr:glycosyltransferase [Oleidesulfovibrio alaskensis]MBL3581900.1 glycosyltransferase [Oleidesulfovibrio alaskensis]